MTSLYTVKAIAGNDWASEKESVVLTTLCKDKALSFAKTYTKENHLTATAVSSYDYFSVNVYEHELETECSEVLIYNSNKGEVNHDTSFPRLFSEEYIENELKHFYRRKTRNGKASPIPKILNVTIGDAVNDSTIKPINSEITKEQFLTFLKKQIKIDLSYVTYENNIYSAVPLDEKIDDSRDWDLYNSFERQFH